ncbi:nuclease A inhibitor family protein [bacterium]|nr:nuclease A inhibitor family protein [bacterium]
MLREAVAGLTYQSETDAAWEAFRWPSSSALSADVVREQGRHPKSAPVVEQSVGEFFKSLTEDQDWYGGEEKAVASKYRSLLTAVKKQLTNPTVFKVGDREVTIYVVGRDKDGGVAGLRTTAVETRIPNRATPRQPSATSPAPRRRHQQAVFPAQARRRWPACGPSTRRTSRRSRSRERGRRGWPGGGMWRGGDDGRSWTCVIVGMMADAPPTRRVAHV